MANMYPQCWGIDFNVFLWYDILAVKYALIIGWYNCPYRHFCITQTIALSFFFLKWSHSPTSPLIHEQPVPFSKNLALCAPCRECGETPHSNWQHTVTTKDTGYFLRLYTPGLAGMKLRTWRGFHVVLRNSLHSDVTVLLRHVKQIAVYQHCL